MQVYGSTYSVIQKTDYYPFGKPYPDGLNPERQPYKFGGKEYDEMHGLNAYDFEARHLDANIPRFTTMDPLCEKYYSVSPYVYCLNNPVRFVDPDGREVWLTMYGEDGNVSEKILYTPAMAYEGDNSFFKQAVSTLNKINSVEAGNTVLGSLSSSENKYYYTNVASTEGSDAATVPMGNAAYFLMGGDASLENTAHELFHGYQLEKGVGGQSITNEVEAYAFGYSVAYNYAMDHYTEAESQTFLNRSSNMGQNNFSGKLYNEAFQNMLTGNILSSFSNNLTAVLTFKGGSLANSSSLYNNYPMQRSNRNYGLLRSFLPLIK
jgi:RHS repeat-associated protein